MSIRITTRILVLTCLVSPFTGCQYDGSTWSSTWGSRGEEKLASEYDAARKLEDEQKLDEALAAYSKLAEVDPQNIHYPHRMAVVSVKLKNIAQASRYFQQALDIDPDNRSVKKDLGVALYLEKHYAPAERAFREALVAQSGDQSEQTTEQIRKHLAAALAANGKPEESLKLYAQMTSPPQAYLSVGMTLARTGKADEARLWLQKAASLTTDETQKGQIAQQIALLGPAKSSPDSTAADVQVADATPDAATEQNPFAIQNASAGTAPVGIQTASNTQQRTDYVTAPKFDIAAEADQPAVAEASTSETEASFAEFMARQNAEGTAAVATVDVEASPQPAAPAQPAAQQHPFEEAFVTVESNPFAAQAQAAQPTVPQAQPAVEQNPFAVAEAATPATDSFANASPGTPPADDQFVAADVRETAAAPNFERMTWPADESAVSGPPVHQTALTRIEPSEGVTITPREEEPVTTPQAKIHPSGTVIPASDFSWQPVKRLSRGTVDSGWKKVCSVTLRDDREFAPGKVEFQSTHKGRVYYFSSPSAKARFDRDPEHYTAARNGADLVKLKEQGMLEDGNIDFARWYNNKIYFFTSAESMRKFANDPVRYAE